MGLSEIEIFLFGGSCAHFVTAFRSGDREVTIEVKPMECNRADGATLVIATFSDATMLSVEPDQNENWEYPLDPIGFDSYAIGDQ